MTQSEPPARPGTTPDAELDGGDRPAEPAPRPRRRWPRSLLLLGLLVALGPLLLVLPASHDVTLRIADPRSLTRLEALWLDGHAGDAASRQTVWNFDPGAAPTELRLELRARRGRYRLQVDSERGGRRSTKTHVVELGVLGSTMSFRVD